MNYYNEIKDTLVKNEIYKKAKDYSKNKSDLNSYYEVGRLLVEAQGGEERAKYGNKLIKEYSEKLTKELGKGYTVSNLRKMRQFYLMFRKRSTLSSELSWSHYSELIQISDDKARDYYIFIIKSQNLSVRELRERVKSKEYERIGYKEELSEPKVNTLIKNPIVIKSKNIPEKITEYALHNLILENMGDFLKELGTGFAYVGHEVKIKLGNNYNYIDFLLFNLEYGCYVVVEIKVMELKADHIGQTVKYMNYVDKNIKKDFHDKTAGIIICKKNNKFVLEYVGFPKLFVSTYNLINV